MTVPMQNIYRWLSQDLRRPAVLLSLMFSIWVIQTNDTVNVDGILYMDAAWQIMQGNWLDARNLYTHLFYPLLIAVFASILPFELETVANLINTIFLTGVSWFFMSILMQLQARKYMLLAGLVVISIHPYINEYRADVIRGPGFWMFLLLYVYLSIRFFRSEKISTYLGSLLCLIFMTLFRAEGIVYLLLSPLLLLTVDKFRTASGLRLITLTYSAVAILIVTVAVLINVFDIMPFDDRIGRPVHYWGEKGQELLTYLTQLVSQLQTHVLPSESAKHGTLGVLVLMATIILATMIKRATLVLLIFALWSTITPQIRRNIPYFGFLLSIAGVNLIYLGYQTIERFFLSSRFAMPTALMVALIASYGVARLFEMPTNRIIKILRGMTVFVFVILTLDGLYSFGASKYYLRDAGSWGKIQLTQNKSLLSNHLVIDHYAGIRHNYESRQSNLRFSNELNNKTINWKLIEQHDFLALRTKHIPASVLQQLEHRYSGAILALPDNTQAKLVVYQIRNP